MEPTPPSTGCEEVARLLSQYLDVELPPQDCKLIEEHLSGCAPCVEFARGLRRTVELCRSYRLSEMPRPISEAARAELLSAYRKMLAARSAGSQ
jgi:predicted anti-sigma-YlaC factor YlaD